MIRATEPDALEAIAHRLYEQGCEGFLLSGGSTSSGEVPMRRFSGAIRKIKTSTDLRINAHVGLMDRDGLSDLVAAGVDAFSVDAYGADSTVRNTLGLGTSGAAAYFRVIEDLYDLDAPLVVPHVCAGLERGTLTGEMRALDMLADLQPEVLVVLVFNPTKGTPYAREAPPKDSDVMAVIRHAIEVLPRTRVNLGCMRPRGNIALELEAVGAGVSGLAVPSNVLKTQLVSEGWDIVEKNLCCAFE